MPIEIIAECGVNHNGNFEVAKKMVHIAKECGADTVKFQIFDPNSIATEKAPLANYQTRLSNSIKSQKVLLEQLCLKIEHHFMLIELCKNLEINYLASVFDINSLRSLIFNLMQKRVKLGSGELCNFYLIRQAVLYNCELLLSTGMNDYHQVNDTVKFINFVAENPKIIPKSHNLTNYINDVKKISNMITLLHCTSQYPTPIKDINLKIIKMLKMKFPFKVGLSDHSKSIISSVTAVGCEIQILEKHFTLNKEDIGPDHTASLNPLEFKQLVSEVRYAELAMGTSDKKILNIEHDVAIVAKKSLVAATEIKKGELFTETNLTVKRPGNGISAKHYFDKIGEISNKAYKKDDLIG